MATTAADEARKRIEARKIAVAARLAAAAAPPPRPLGAPAAGGGCGFSRCASCARGSQAKACATLVPGQVLKQKKPALPGDHEVEVPIAIQVGYRNLHAASGARAVVHHVLAPSIFLPPSRRMNSYQ